MDFGLSNGFSGMPPAEMSRFEKKQVWAEKS